MRILILLALPLFLSLSSSQKCLDDYNAAVLERNNGTGSYKIALNSKKQADGRVDSAKRKRYLNESQEATVGAIGMLERSEGLLKTVRKNCASTFVEKADALSEKNKMDLSTYKEFNVELDRALKNVK